MNEKILAAISIAIIFAGVVFLLRRFKPTVPNLGNPESFARLVLAEIVVYDRKAAENAWSRSEVYTVLKSDIDRARSMFLKRFPTSEDVFYQSLVKILGRGQPDRLGADYPYPRSAANP